MVKTLILSSLLFGMASFSPALAQKSKGPNNNQKTEVKFLDDISIDIAPSVTTLSESTVKATQNLAFAKVSTSPLSVEQATELQLKYAIMLDTEVEQVAVNQLYQHIDEWWGTRYQYGGSTKNGIDCSAFSQLLYNGHFGISLPRTAREQYEVTMRINREDLKEGDLVFFNTRGGVSHVGVYLQNNKFTHSATSGGVMISDLDDAYWAKRYLGAGRYEKNEPGFLVGRP
jgi:lipoprotein Spr